MRAEITPVSIEDIPRFFRHFDSLENFVDRVRAYAHKIGILRKHNLLVSLAVDGIAVSLCRVNFLAKRKELFHRRTAVGYVTHHFVNKLFYAERHSSVEFFLTRDYSVSLGNLQPFYFIGYPQRVKQISYVAAVFFGTEVVELVQRSFKLKSASFKTRCKSAGNVVLFHKQYLVSALQQSNRGNQTAVTCADNDRIILYHRRLLLIFYIICFLLIFIRFFPVIIQ